MEYPDGWFVPVCAELDEEPLLANTTLICGNCADRLMADQDLLGDSRTIYFPFPSAILNTCPEIPFTEECGTLGPLRRPYGPQK